MKQSIILVFILVIAAFLLLTFDVTSTSAQMGPLQLTPTPMVTPTHMPYDQKIFYGNQQETQNQFLEVTALGAPVRGDVNDWWADVVIGQPDFSQITPNEVVANKLFNPGGVYVDRSMIPNRLYVYDGGNSRILGFSSLGTCSAGSNAGGQCTSDSDCPSSSCVVNSTKTPEVILGQPLPNTSACNGDSGFQNYPNLPVPSASSLCGLRPESISILEGGSIVNMATDSQGNLYHPDYFNNRILRYDNPFSNDTVADYVWGQLDFEHAACNYGRSYGYPDNQSLCFAAPMLVGSLKIGLAIDSGGSLWVSDIQNHRVLRFPYDVVLGAPSQQADLVLGQANFSTATPGTGLNQMMNPGAVRVDNNGTVYVLDGLDGWGTHGRLLIFHPPLFNGMAANEVFNGLGEPSGLELDPADELWVNSGSQSKLLRLTNGQLQVALNTIVPVQGGIGIDRDMNFLMTGSRSQEVHLYSPPNYSWTNTFVQAEEYGFFNRLGPRSLNDPAGMEITDDQLIVSDQTRLLFWNHPSQLTSSYPPADGVIGQPNFTTRPKSGPIYGRLRADTNGHLWVLKGGQGHPSQIVAYQLPLNTGAQPVIQISSPIPLLGGGSFTWSPDFLILGGIAYQPDCDCLWVSDTEYNRAFRIRNVSSTQRVVDIVLGQTSPEGTHCNHGLDSDNGYVRPSSASRNSLCHPGGLALDRNGNLFLSDHNLEIAGNQRLLEYDALTLPLAPATAIFGVSASRVYGRNGSFTASNCVANDPMCGPWEPAFDSNNQMVVGFNGYLGPMFPQIYFDPLNNALSSGALLDYFSHAYSARFDATDNLYVLDLTRSRVLIYRRPQPIHLAVRAIRRADSNPTNAVSVSFTVTFSDIVTGVDMEDFALTTSGVTGASIMSVAGSDDTYTVTVNTGTGNGKIRLDVMDDDSIKDTLGAPLGGIGQGNGRFTRGEEYSILKLGLTPPSVPALVSPINNAAVSICAPTLNWSDSTVSSGAVLQHYQVQIATDIDFNNIITDTDTYVEKITNSEYELRNDYEASTKFYWRVRAFNILDIASNWSTVWSFKTPLCSPTLLSPNNGGNLLVHRPTFQWDAMKGASQYNLQLAVGQRFTTLLVNITLNGTQYTMTKDLPQNVAIYWRVRAKTSTTTGPWSLVRSFIIPLGAPGLLSPPNDYLKIDRPIFAWDAVNGASQYNLQVSTGKGFRTLLFHKTLSATEYVMTQDLPENTMIYWRVRARTSTTAGPWKGGLFKTGNPPSVPVLSAPANNALVRDYTPILNWKDSTISAGTTFKYYELQVDASPTFDRSEVKFLTDIHTSSFVPASELASNTKFYWRVRAINTVDHMSAWSPVWSFRTIIPPASGLAMLPRDPELLKPLLDWDDVAGPFTNYTIQISTSASFSTFLVNSTTQTSSYTLLKDLPAGKTIYWRVRANGANGPSVWSKSQFLTP